jgi:hypothetical protein
MALAVYKHTYDKAIRFVRLTPRQKFKQAIIALEYELPHHGVDLVWSNRKRIYRLLGQVGWHWEKHNKRLGFWSGVPF